MSTDDEPTVMTIPEVAALLRLKRSTAYRYAQTGVLPATKIGRYLYIDRADLAALLDKNTAGEGDQTDG